MVIKYEGKVYDVDWEYTDNDRIIKIVHVWEDDGTEVTDQFLQIDIDEMEDLVIEQLAEEAEWEAKENAYISGL